VTQKLYGVAEVGYQSTVWGGYRFGDGLKQTNQTTAPIVQSLLGWKIPRLDTVFERNTDLDSTPRRGGGSFGDGDHERTPGRGADRGRLLAGRPQP